METVIATITGPQQCGPVFFMQLSYNNAKTKTYYSEAKNKRNYNSLRKKGKFGLETEGGVNPFEIQNSKILKFF